MNHTLLTEVAGQRIRLRRVPTRDAIYLVSNDVAEFENAATQKEATTLLQFVFGKPKAKNDPTSALLA